MSPITLSPVLPANLFTEDDPKSEPANEERAEDCCCNTETSGLEFLFCARCFFSSANVPALIVTET